MTILSNQNDWRKSVLKLFTKELFSFFEFSSFGTEIFFFELVISNTNLKRNGNHTKLVLFFLDLSEKMLICAKKKCPFPFDVDDVSPYIIKVDSLVNTNSFAEPSSSSSSLSPSSPSSPSSSSSSSLLDEKFLSLKTPSKPTLNLTKSVKSKSKSHNSSSTEGSLLNPIRLSKTKSNGVLSTQSEKEISNLPNSESFPNVNIEMSPTESNNLSTNPKSINAGSITQSLTLSNNEEPLNPFNKVIPEETISNSDNNNTITLKTLGVTLKVDQPNKNISQPNSSQFNGLSTDTIKNKFSITASGADADVDAGVDDTATTTAAEKDLISLFNMNDFPVTTVEGSSANTTNYLTGNGLLNANTTSEVDGSNALTVEEYSKMLFGQSDIDINFDLDNMLPNFNTMDVNMQGNDANMENMENMDNMDNMDLDELFGTYDSLESSKISGNGMNLDFDSFMASLGGDLAEAEIPNDMSDIYAEMVNGNSNEKSENNSMLVDMTFRSVNGQNGYHENIEKIKDGVNGVVEDEGKNVNVVGKTINGDSVTLNIGEKEVDQKKDCET
ncbi:uncharacterized protein OCT59_025250 [Rhizophagus irregularis]|uniref:Uncharacterized protein n=1 Tax=Rhizophagus irregularis TaxID=588596 RepID=A0A915ZJA3_9GLOM|nr:hypothetical protein OCT59_025250 [Rhizophagus irregularis]CAB4464904.1 unnamed protein product [Rhizophagus irregularis]CAB5379406.1 unnamed protein product [Rhizophagus irregularis]